MFRKICCAYDGSIGAKRALGVAIRLAHEQAASLCILTVHEPPPQYVDSPGEAEINEELETRYTEHALQDAQERARAEGVGAETAARSGHPAQCIVRFLEDGAYDLLVIGHSGHSEIWGRFLGGTVDKVVRHAPCSVLVVRSEPAEGSTQASGDLPAEGL